MPNKYHCSVCVLAALSLAACSEVGGYQGPREDMSDMSAQGDMTSAQDMPQTGSDMNTDPGDMGSSPTDMPDTPTGPAPPSLNATGTPAGIELAWSPVPDALRYEVRIDGGDWINVLGEQTYVDEEAPAGVVLSAVVEASDATRREAGDLLLSQVETEPGPKRTYEVRAILADATTEPSEPATASRPTEITGYQWQYTDSLETPDWKDLDGATMEMAEDPSARDSGAERHYRVSLSNNAGEDALSMVDAGFKLAVIQVGAGAGYSCALLNNGSVKCWGHNNLGQLGYGDTQTRGIAPGDMPPPNVELGGKAKQLSVGGGYNCVVMEDDSLRCWGGMSASDGSDVESIGDEPGEMPPPIIPLPSPLKKLPVSGGTHQCVLLETGIFCWGTNEQGALGQGDTTWRWMNGETNFPTEPVNLGGEVVDVENGLGYSCAILTTGEMKCWGNVFGASVPYGDAIIGDEPNEMPPASLPVVPDTYDIKAQSEGFGSAHRCVMADYTTSSGKAIYCWGSNFSGQLGIGDNESIGSQPDDLPGPRITYDTTAEKIATGLTTTCLLKENGRLFCWGGGIQGNYTLGPDFDQFHGDDTNELRPKEAVLGATIKDISASLIHYCALTTSGTVKCWGDGEQGALGYENANDLGAPGDAWPPPDVKLF